MSDQDNPILSQAIQTAGALITNGRAADAIDLLKRTLAHAPRNLDALVLLAQARAAQGDLSGAERAARQAAKFHPESGIAPATLGTIQMMRGDAAQALSAFDQALALLPNHPRLLFNRGCALAALGRFGEAEQAHALAVAGDPGFAAAHNNRGTSLYELGRPDQAVAAYDAALAAQPEYGDAAWNRALALLILGRWEDGWEAFGARWRRSGITEPDPIAAPLRPGEAVAGKTILLRAEQGLGDAIQFLRYAQPLAERGARVIAQVKPPLLDLAKTAPGVSDAILQDQSAPADRQLWMLDAPAVLGLPAPLPAATPYLSAKPAAIDAPGRKVAVCWAGNPAHDNDARRSLAQGALARLADLDGISFFSVQVGDRACEADAMLPGITDLSGGLSTLADTASVLAAMDAVISVDTAVAHLAGALGRTGFVLLPFAPDWRWGQAGERSPWYDSLTLLRQSSPGDWAGVIAELARRIA